MTTILHSTALGQGETLLGLEVESGLRKAIVRQLDEVWGCSSVSDCESTMATRQGDALDETVWVWSDGGGQWFLTHVLRSWREMSSLYNPTEGESNTCMPTRRVEGEAELFFALPH